VTAPLQRLDRLRLWALALHAAPFVVLLVFGVLWVRENRAAVWWLIGAGLLALLAHVAQRHLLRRHRALFTTRITQAAAHWTPREEQVWAHVEHIAAGANIETTPLNDPARLLELSLTTLRTVASFHHPDKERPLLEMTLPHALLILERAARDLRQDIAGHIPFSHKVTMGDLARAHDWKRRMQKWEGVFRVGRAVVSPMEAILAEAGRQFRLGSFDAAWSEVQTWILREMVRKVGRHAIDLYSGRLPLDDAPPETWTSEDTRRHEDAATRHQNALQNTPLYVLVMGMANAGKSSLINALFGTVTAPVDALPSKGDTFQPHQLEREGGIRALVFDCPACEGQTPTLERFEAPLRSADLVLWVTACNRADRLAERQALDTVRLILDGHHRERPPIPLLVVASRIDQLRPLREWSPPYNIVHPDSEKAKNMAEAVEAIAHDLRVPQGDVVPVCLAEGREYNVSDVLWTEIVERLPAAERSRALRCLTDKKRAENWGLLRAQLAAAGRLLVRGVGGRKSAP